MCNLPPPDMNMVITEPLRNLHPAFKRLFKEPLKGCLKSNRDHQTLQLFLRVLSGVEGEGADWWDGGERNYRMSSCI